MSTNRAFLSIGGIATRVIEAINGFKTKHGHWPTSISMPAETIAVLATQCLTPLGMFLLQSKIKITIGSPDGIVTTDELGRTFDYGSEGWQTTEGHGHDALQWLGLD